MKASRYREAFFRELIAAHYETQLTADDADKT